jgi:predicted DNA-binding transcriptional regulator AlpA
MTLDKVSKQIDELRSLVIRATPPEVMSTEEAAEFLGMNRETLFRWRKDGTGPAYSQPNHRIVRYQKADLVAFLDQHKGGRG